MKIIKPQSEILIPHGENPVLEHLERCGRVCYKSEDKITPGSARKFIRAITRNGHLAVIEHYRFIVEVSRTCYNRILAIQPEYLKMSCIEGRYLISGSARGFIDLYNLCLIREFDYDYTNNADYEFSEFYLARIMVEIREAYDCDVLFAGEFPILAHSSHVRGFVSQSELSKEEYLIHGWFTTRSICDRGVSHEMVRHRPASFCQESTRYCNYSKSGFGGEITVIVPTKFKTDSLAYDLWKKSCMRAESDYFDLIAVGNFPQDARSVLPNSLKTEVVMTATIEEWLHFFKLRTAPDAHPDMIVTANLIKQAMSEKARYGVLE